ncbi:hypothetical protein [Streptomyces ureilyticus]|uniref:Uncharacterized protein n=1 Tax=Streptomyces ureilyticus TaxID=1775131 RepID=A0ABX0DH24_9ACTN|nr:hypothetical protein [Streptomyces ureilyticus]NGO41171.1 hypothetical protein [Streptomyces ureilyticus]
MLGLAGDGAREYLPGRLKEHKVGIDGGYEVVDAAELPDIVGLTEIPWVCADVPDRPGLGGGCRSVRGGTPERRFLHDRTSEALIPGAVLWRSTPTADDGRLDPDTTV